MPRVGRCGSRSQALNVSPQMVEMELKMESPFEMGNSREVYLSVRAWGQP